MSVKSLIRLIFGRKQPSRAEIEKAIQIALDEAYEAGRVFEQNQQWLRDTTGPKPRIRITC